MQNLHEKIGSQLIDAVEKYMNDEIPLEDVILIQEKENLIYKYDKWSSMKKELKESLFEITRDIFTDVNECSKNIQVLEKINESKIIECDLDGIISHSFLLNRNRAPPVGFEHSNWYLGPYSTFQMAEALVEEDNV